MPKKTLVIRDFKSGLVFSTHGVDNPEDSLSRAGNVNVNRKNGVITLSGAFEKLQIPNNMTDAMENFVTPDCLFGFRGAGTFYFTSDYDNINPLTDGVNSAGTNGIYRFGEDVLTEHHPGSFGSWVGGKDKGSNRFIIGPKSETNNPTGYYVVASQQISAGLQGGSHNLYKRNGNRAAILHIYEEDLSNIGSISNDGSNNGWVVDIPMGLTGTGDGTAAIGSLGDSGAYGYNAISYTGHVDTQSFFPVYYFARGGLRVCDGSFNGRNSQILTIQYIQDPLDVFSEGQSSYHNFLYDNWVMTRHSFDKNELTANIGNGYYMGDKGLPAPQQFKCIREFKDSNSSLPYFNGTDLGIVHDSIHYLSLHESDEEGPFPQDKKSGGLNYFSSAAGDSWVGNNEVFDIVTSGGSPVEDPGVVCFGFGYESAGNVYLNRGWTLYASWVYKTGEESIPKEIDATIRNRIGVAISGETLGRRCSSGEDDTSFDAVALLPIVFVNIDKRRADPRIVGMRIYSKGIGASLANDSNISRTTNLLFEVDWWKGMRLGGSSTWTDWELRELDEANSACTTARVYSGGGSSGGEPIRDPLPEETFESFHGYSPDQIGKCFYKTAVVTNNRVYVGNVKFNDALYPDRIMMTQPGEFDTFIEGDAGMINVAVDDGDSIYHLEAYADRLLSFKKNIVHIINIQNADDPYLELSAKFAGVTSQCQVVATDKGVYWANSNGLFFYNGEEIVNLLEGLGFNYSDRDTQVSSSLVTDTVDQWSNIISNKEGDEPIVTYDPKNKDVIVMNQGRQYEEMMLNKGDQDVKYQLEVSAGHNWTAHDESGSDVIVIEQNGSIYRDYFEIRFSTDNEEEGMQLHLDNLQPLESGKTYIVTFVGVASGFSTSEAENFKIELGGAATLMRTSDHYFTAGLTGDSDWRTYYAIVTAGTTHNYFRIYHEPVNGKSGGELFRVNNISVSPYEDINQFDVGFVWNTEYNNLMQLFDKSFPHNDRGYIHGSGKSNPIIDAEGIPRIIDNVKYGA